MNDPCIYICDVKITKKIMATSSQKETFIDYFFEKYPIILINNDFASENQKEKFFSKIVKDKNKSKIVSYKILNIKFSSKLQYEFKE